MPKKEKNINTRHAHDLVIFKEKKTSKSKAIEEYSFEKVDQEDKIKLINDFKPFGSHFQYTIFISNESLAPITEVKIKVKFPEFLDLIRYYPISPIVPRLKTEKNIQYINLEFDELKEKSHKYIYLHFTPNTLDIKGEIRTIVTYVNNKDTIRVLDSRPLEITVDNILIEPKVLPSSSIREFAQQPGIKNVIKGMGVGIKHHVESETYFEILEQVFLIHNFQLVAKDINKKILWFFGTESKIKKDILAVGQINLNKIELMASSLNHYLLISFLVLIANDFKNHLISNEIIKPQDDIFDLDCKNCGAILPYFPKKHESVVCVKCNVEQLVW